MQWVAINVSIVLRALMPSERRARKFSAALIATVRPTKFTVTNDVRSFLA
jgi:hypothetical protein